jgi:hypothetical protein
MSREARFYKSHLLDELSNEQSHMKLGAIRMQCTTSWANQGLTIYSHDNALSTKKVAVFVFPAVVELARPQV